MGASAQLQPVTVQPLAFRNILFATDFSETSKAALPFALAFAKRHGAALFVTHVLPAEPRYELPMEPQPDAVNARKQQACARFDELLASGVLNDVVHEPILRTGPFWETIQDVICSRSIDLIVTGTHGRQGVGKMLLGSVAETIFRNAACPVLTVGPHVSAELVSDGMRRVLYATDFSPASLHALPHAYSLAQDENAQLTLLHVLEAPPPAVDAMILPEIDAESADDTRRRLKELVDGFPALPQPPEVIAISGAPSDAIVLAAAELRAAVIVLGVRHKSSVATHFPWSIADAVVCRAHCPVLTVRGE